MNATQKLLALAKQKRADAENKLALEMSRAGIPARQLLRERQRISAAFSDGLLLAPKSGVLGWPHGLPCCSVKSSSVTGEEARMLDLCGASMFYGRRCVEQAGNCPIHADDNKKEHRHVWASKKRMEDARAWAKAAPSPAVIRTLLRALEDAERKRDL